MEVVFEVLARGKKDEVVQAEKKIPTFVPFIELNKDGGRKTAARRVVGDPELFPMISVLFALVMLKRFPLDLRGCCETYDWVSGGM